MPPESDWTVPDHDPACWQSQGEAAFWRGAKCQVRQLGASHGEPDELAG